MTEFSICLDTKEFKSEGDLVVSGMLRIGELEEEFHASLSYWSRKKYQHQWIEALERVLNGKQHSAVVTTMYNPNTANFIFWWVMYLIGGKVHIQNHVLFLDDLDQPFDESDLYSLIPERETKTEDGNPISEWIVHVSSIKISYYSMKRNI